jgi:chorismate mutase
MSDNTECAIWKLRSRIDAIDREICALVHCRTILSRLIGEIRRSTGGPRIVKSREQEIQRRYGELGMPGYKLAELLLELGRGPDSQAGK